MVQPVSKKAQGRLKRIEGQVKGITKMVEEGRECEDVLIQMKAVQGALRSTAALLLVEHMDHCVKDAIASGHGEEAVDRMRDSLGQIMDM